MRCEETVKILEVLRLWEEGYSQREIAGSVKCAKSTVGEIQRRSREQGLDYGEASGMTNAQIHERLYPKEKAEVGKHLRHDPTIRWKALRQAHLYEKHGRTGGYHLRSELSVFPAHFWYPQQKSRKQDNFERG